MITRQPSPPAANGRRFGTMRPRRTRYVTRNQGVFRNRKNRFHTWTEIFSGLTERCDATFLINSCPPFSTRPGRKRGPASAGSFASQSRLRGKHQRGCGEGLRQPNPPHQPDEVVEEPFLG